MVDEVQTTDTEVYLYVGRESRMSGIYQKNNNLKTEKTFLLVWTLTPLKLFIINFN